MAGLAPHVHAARLPVQHAGPGRAPMCPLRRLKLVAPTATPPQLHEPVVLEQAEQHDTTEFPSQQTATDVHEPSPPADASADSPKWLEYHGDPDAFVLVTMEEVSEELDETLALEAAEVTVSAAVTAVLPAAEAAATISGRSTGPDSGAASSSAAHYAADTVASAPTSNASSSRDMNGSSTVSIVTSTAASTATSSITAQQRTSRTSATRKQPLGLWAQLQLMEQRLEADWVSLTATLLLVVGTITFEFGIQSLLDHYLGDSRVGDVCCVVGGLGMVWWCKLKGYRWTNLFNG